MRRIRRLVAQAVLFFALFEAALRLYNPLPFRVRGSHIVLPVRHVYTFDTHTVPSLDPVTRHSKNSLGFRGPDPPRDLATRMSLVTIGGSTTECLFISDGKTWTDELARRLQRWRPDIWVNNAGLDGQSTYGHLILLRDFIADLRPKVAVFLVGINDVERDDANTYDSALAPKGGLGRKAMLYAIDRVETLALVQNLVRSARARQRGFGHGSVDVRTLLPLGLDPRVIEGEVAHQQKYLGGYAERLRRIGSFCREHGIEPIFVTQPALFGSAIDPATGVDLGTRQFTGRGSGEADWQVLEVYNDVTRRVAQEQQIALVDLAHLLPKDSRYFYDHLHYSIEGARRVGEIIADGVEPFLRRRFASE